MGGSYLHNKNKCKSHAEFLELLLCDFGSIQFEMLTNMITKSTIFLLVSTCCLLLLVSCLAYFSTKKMKVICSSNTLDFLQTRGNYNPEGCTQLLPVM
jgi:hypothetical protein